MEKTYPGNTPELYKLFISGKQLQYSQFGQSDWIDIPIYNGDLDDIYRVAGTYHTFRVKPKDVITKVYMHYNSMEEMVQNNDFYVKVPTNCMFDKPTGMNEHLEFTFTNGKLTKVEMKDATN